MSVFACENMLEKEILMRQVKEKQGMTNNDEGSISFVPIKVPPPKSPNVGILNFHIHS